MSPQEFCYWLQGFLEVSGAKSLDAQQTRVVKEHLALIFTKVTGASEKDAGRTADKLEALAKLPMCSRSLRLC